MVEWVIGVVQAGGWPAVLFLMFLENLFPPIPSEVILPLAGYRAEEGELNVVLVWVAATAVFGNVKIQFATDVPIEASGDRTRSGPTPRS